MRKVSLSEYLNLKFRSKSKYFQNSEPLWLEPSEVFAFLRDLGVELLSNKTSVYMVSMNCVSHLRVAGRKELYLQTVVNGEHYVTRVIDQDFYNQFQDWGHDVSSRGTMRMKGQLQCC